MTAPTVSAICFGDGVAIPAPGHIEHHALGLAAGVENVLRRFGRRLLVDIEHHHARALARIAQRDGAADAGACAGDDRDVIFEKAWSFLCLLIFARG